MATDVGSLQIKIFAGISQLQSDMDKANRTVNQFATRTEASLGRVSNAFKGLALGGAITAVKRMADDYAKFDTQLKLATTSTQEYAKAYKSVVGISKASQSDIGAIGNLYARITRNGRSAGVSQANVAKITETVSLALRVSNASAQESSSTMLQLSQAFGSGALMGQEFMAVAESAPILLEQLAKSMNVPYESLRKLREEGKLTSAEMLKAFTNPAFLDSLRTQAKEIRTIGAAQTYFINQLKLYIGESDKAIGVSRLLSGAIKLIADNIVYLADVAIAYAIKKLFDFGQAKLAFMANAQAQSKQLILNSAQEAQADNLKAAQQIANIEKEMAIGKLRLLNSQALIKSKIDELNVVALSTAGTAKELTALKAIEAQKIKLIAVESRLHAIQAVTGVNMTNNAAATTFMASKLGVATVAMTNMQRVALSATTAVTGLNRVVGLIGGWVGVAITALVLFGDKLFQATKNAIGLTTELERYNAVRERANELNGMGISAADPFVAEKEKIEKTRLALKENIDALERYKKALKGDFSGLSISDEMAVSRGGRADPALIKQQISAINEVIKQNIDIVQDAQDAMKATTTSTTDAIKAQAGAFADLTKQHPTKQQIIDEYAAKIKGIRDAGAAEKIAASEIDAAVKQQERARDKEIQSLTDKVKITKEEKTVNQEINQVLENRKSAQNEIDDHIKVNELLKQGKDLSEATLRVEGLRKGLTTELVDELLKQKTIQEGILKNSEMIADAEKDRLKAILDEGDRQREFDDKKLKEFQDAEEEKRREYEKTAETLQSSINDALLRGFENGKSIADNFKTTLKNTFKTLVLQPTISYLTSPLSKAVAGITGALGSGNATAGESGSSIGLSDIKGLFDSFSTDGIQRSVENLGVTLVDKGFDNLGGMIGANSAMLSKALPYSGAIFSALKGDFKDAAIQGAATYLGSLTPLGPIGGAIIGQAVSSLFGGKKQPKRTGGVSNTSISDGVYSQNNINTDRKFNSISSFYDPINSSTEAFSNTLSTFSKAFGGSGNVSNKASYFGRSGGGSYKTFSGSIDGNAFNANAGQGKFGDEDMQDFISKITGEYLAKAIQSTNIGTNLKTLFDGLVDSQSVSSMINATMALNEAQKELANKYGLTVDEAARVAKATGLSGQALAQYVSVLAGVTAALRTPAQQILSIKDTIVAQLGGSLPETLDQFDARLKAINKTTEAGAKEFNNLFSLRDKVAAYQDGITGIKNGIEQSMFNLMSPNEQLSFNQAKLSKSFADLNLTVPKTAQDFINLSRGLDLNKEVDLDIALALPKLVEQFNAVNAAVEETAALFNELNENQFRNVIDFNRAKAYKSQGMEYKQLLANVPSYDVGTPYVPSDGLAMLHKGEAVITANENATAPSSNASLLAELQMLRQEVSELKYEAKQTSQYTKNTENILRRVSNGGNSLNTTVA